ncbi:hypothetical protein B0H16DRAFT_1640122 [Mycena metata]|uniref:Uncharacterized protein n=1 Tax=Mycena metata TaxID=1033252 RepID=A0AAD7DYR4_9AGAR|nr:hypothetical protein B0H16DRAFT_1640122 [Mycena metata]
MGRAVIIRLARGTILLHLTPSFISTLPSARATCHVRTPLRPPLSSHLPITSARMRLSAQPSEERAPAEATQSGCCARRCRRGATTRSAYFAQARLATVHARVFRVYGVLRDLPFINYFHFDSLLSPTPLYIFG